MAARSGAAPSHALDGHHYFQRELPGTPCSATFVANGTDAAVIGFNQMIVRRFGAWPFVFCGALGPVRLDPQVTAEVTAVVRALASEFSLRGLGSLDFMLDGESFGVLELNPRPPASIALYGREHFPAAPRGVLAAHVRACIEGELPCWPAHAGNHLVRGIEIVYAARALGLDANDTARLGARAGCHDLPAAATRFKAGDPLCSVSASGTNAAQVRELLARACKAVHDSLETIP
jgi:predicted ATP-grasp superfamily ATP-dependent carboligase